MGPEPTNIHASVEHLSAFLEQRLAAAERQALVEHLGDCGDCRYELAQASRLIASAPRPRRRALYVTLAIAAGVAAVMLGRSPNVMTDPPSEERSQRVVEPDVVTPIAVVAPTDGSEVGGEPIVLTWRPDAPGALYRVSVQDSAGGVKWTGSTSDTSVVIPANIVGPRGTTYWSVDARRADGRTTTSRAHWFHR